MGEDTVGYGSPEGWKCVLVFENLAVSTQQSAFSQTRESFATLCLLGLGLGLGLGDPRVTQASRKGDPSVDSRKPCVCNEKREMPGGVRKSKPYHLITRITLIAQTHANLG